MCSEPRQCETDFDPRQLLTLNRQCRRVARRLRAQTKTQSVDSSSFSVLRARRGKTFPRLCLCFRRYAIAAVLNTQSHRFSLSAVEALRVRSGLYLIALLTRF